MVNLNQSPGLFRRFTVAACAFSLFACVCQRADASCGDYVVVGGSDADLPPNTMNEMPTHRMPCQGPNCQRRQPTKPLPAPLPRVLSYDPFAAWFSSNGVEGGSKSTSCFDSADATPLEGFRHRIDRPPRI